MGSVINGYNKTPIFIKLAIGMAIGALLAIYCPKPFMWVDGLGITFVKILKYMSEVQKIPKIHFGSKSNQTHHSKNPKRSQISRF